MHNGPEKKQRQLSQAKNVRCHMRQVKQQCKVRESYKNMETMQSQDYLASLNFKANVRACET